VTGTGGSGPRPGPSRGTVYSFFLLGFFAIFSTTISKTPVLPLFSQALGADDAFIGLIAVFSPLAGILFSFPMGVLSDRLGRRRLLVAAGAVFLTAPLLYLLVGDPAWLIPVRFFHGTATAILGPVVSAVIAERFAARKGEVLGQYSSATLLGRTLAPLAGGAILSSFVAYPGLLEFRLVYAVAALAAVPVFVMTLFYREAGAAPLALPSLSVFRESFVAFVANRRLRGTALADMATYFAFGAFETFLPLLLASRGIGAYETGVVFAVQVLVIAATKPLFGRLADRADKRVLIAAGLVVLGGSAGVVPLASSFPVLLAVSALFGLGMAVSTVATTAYVADVAKGEEIGASMGALSSIMDIGHSAGPLVTGMVIAAAGYASGFLVSAVLAAVVTVVFAASVAGPGRRSGERA
jgi:MFS family permease